MNMNTSFFLEGVQGNDVVARLISLSSCGDMSGGAVGAQEAPTQGEQFSPFRYGWSAHSNNRRS